MKQRLSTLPMLFAAATISVVGCSAGGSSPSPGPTPAPTPTPTPTPPPVTSPTLQVVPATFDFGKVTTSNRPAPLEVTIRNSGNAALNVSAISFLAPADPSFMLNTSLGTKPCASVSPTLAAGDSCTVQIAFQPPATAGSFASTLQIRSNDPTSPNFGLPMQGASEAVSALTVKVNQIDTFPCTNPTTNPLTTAYVSVIDQGGYPVLGLQSGAFSVNQGLPPALLPIISASFVGNIYQNVAIAALLDHSKSLMDQPVAFADMKTGFTNLLAGLKGGDIAEVIKFATEYQVVQAFTNNKTLLQAAIAAPFSMGTGTRLYDTVYQAVDNTALQPASYRKAVILATDGVQELPPSAPPAVQNIDTVIANAKSKNVPIFTIGIGAAINATDLGRMATETGGLYYQANASQNLATIYQQLSSLLYENQYVLSFNRAVVGAATVQSPVVITAGSGTLSGSSAKSIVVCP
jgi:Ca-activated chloride channel family protein